jgi:hypothetical protein
MSPATAALMQRKSSPAGSRIVARWRGCPWNPLYNLESREK